MWGFVECTSQSRLDEKTAIVTGGNRGLGRCTVADFYKRGCKVIMACRNVESAEVVKNEIIADLSHIEYCGSIIVRHLDLASLSSVREFALRVSSEEERVHILVNNAGYAGAKRYTEDGFEMSIGINSYGPFLLTMLLLPVLMRSTPARIVNVSSQSYLIGSLDLDDLHFRKNTYWLWRSYTNSKLALMLLSYKLAKLLQDTGVNVYIVHPGIIRTEMYNSLHPCFRIPYLLFTWMALRTEEQGAQTQIHCAVDEGVQSENGLYYIDCRPSYVFSKGRDDETATKLLAIVCNEVGIENFDRETLLMERDLATQARKSD